MQVGSKIEAKFNCFAIPPFEKYGRDGQDF